MEYSSEEGKDFAAKIADIGRRQDNLEKYIRALVRALAVKPDVTARDQYKCKGGCSHE